MGHDKCHESVLSYWQSSGSMPRTTNVPHTKGRVQISVLLPLWDTWRYCSYNNSPPISGAPTYSTGVLLPWHPPLCLLPNATAELLRTDRYSAFIWSCQTKTTLPLSLTIKGVLLASCDPCFSRGFPQKRCYDLVHDSSFVLIFLIFDRSYNHLVHP